MKSFWKPVAMALAVGAFACACATPVGAQLSDERALSDVQRIYKNAALVVMGECVQSHINSEGDTCYDLSVEEVVAGYAQAGDIIHCTQGAMKEGETYLLYLAEGEEMYHTEDMRRYELLSDAPLPVSENGTVAFAGTQLALSDIKRDIERMDAVITAPATMYYYKELGALIDAADEVFIGRVASISPVKDMAFRSQTDGTIIENTLPAALAQVEAYGVLKGALNYGDPVDLVYAPAMSANLVDASTLKALSYGEANAPALEEGEVYLFFLTQSPDAKQAYRFSVNPMQGYARVDKDDHVHVSHVNSALAGCKDLGSLVREIRDIMES